MTASVHLPAAGTNNVWYYRGSGDTVVVFVHGIFSDSRACWLREDPPPQYWPALLRADSRFGDASIYLGGFYTQVDAGDFDLADCAQELLSALKRPAADGTASVLSSCRRLFFICHSTGGIVVRYMLERWGSDFDAYPIGVALIASPSLGSAWADLAKQLATFYEQRLGLQLRTGSENLNDLDERFRDLVKRRTAMLHGGEAHENRFILHRRWLPRIRRVVEPSSAGRGYWGAPINLPGTDHFTAVKPRTLSDRPHTFVVDVWTNFIDATGGNAGLGAWVPPEHPLDLGLIETHQERRRRFWLGPVIAVAATTIIGFAIVRSCDPSPRVSDTSATAPITTTTTTVPATEEIPSEGGPLTQEQRRVLEELLQRQPAQFRKEDNLVTGFWPNGSVINLAFLNGTPELHEEVKTAISNWTRGTTVRVAYVAPGDSEVRVIFNDRGASWSYLGTQALAVERTEPTTVLGIQSVAAGERESAIYHEVGHILGLIHEHQIPTADIVDWDVAEAEASGPPNFWPRAQLQANLRPYTADRVATVYRSKVFDPTSVMLFQFPDAWLKTPVRPRRTPSPADLALVRAIYR